MTCFLQQDIIHNKLLLHQIFNKVLSFSSMEDYEYDGKFSILIKTPKFTNFDAIAFICVYTIEKDITQDDLTNLLKIYEPYYAMERGSSVLVFDLDDTIINKNREVKLINDHHEYYNMQLLRSHYDFIGLWSHGTYSHVEQFKKILDEFNFDFYLNRFNDYQGPKYAAHILKTLNVTNKVDHLTLACLVDDCDGNYSDDYDIFIEINGHKKIKLSDLIKTIYDETIKERQSGK